MEENPYGVKCKLFDVRKCVDIQCVGETYMRFREIPHRLRDKPLQRDISRHKFAADKKRKELLLNNLLKTIIMKKLMIIAVIISGMLMPAQVFAKNDRNEKKGVNRVQVDHNRVQKSGSDKKVINVGKNKPAAGKQVVVHHNNPAPVVVHHNNPAPVVVHHCNPAPVVVHHPKPVPAVVHHHCDNGIVEAAAVAVGIAGLISLLAN